MLSFRSIYNKINEDYNTTTKKFVDAGANPEEVKSYIQRFRALNNAQKLQGDEKNIDNWGKRTFDQFKEFIENKESEESKTSKRKQEGKRFDLQAPEGWNFYIPLDKAAACYKTDKATDWCVAKRDWEYFEKYIYGDFDDYRYHPNNPDKRFLVYVLRNLDKKYWAFLFNAEPNAKKTLEINDIKIYNSVDAEISSNEFIAEVGDKAVGQKIYNMIVRQAEKLTQPIRQEIEKTRNASLEWMIATIDGPNKELEDILLKKKDKNLILKYMRKTQTVMYKAAYLFADTSADAYAFSLFLSYDGNFSWKTTNYPIPAEVRERAERSLARDVDFILKYVQKTRSRFPLGEETLLKRKKPKELYDYMYYTFPGKERWIEAEPIFAENARLGFKYAAENLDEPFKELEENIKNNTIYIGTNNLTYLIMQYINKFYENKRVKFLEEFLIKNIDPQNPSASIASDNAWQLYTYALEYIKGPYSKSGLSDELITRAEQTIANVPEVAVDYTINLMQERWREIEYDILGNYWGWRKYSDHFDLKTKDVVPDDYL